MCGADSFSPRIHSFLVPDRSSVTADVYGGVPAPGSLPSIPNFLIEGSRVAQQLVAERGFTQALPFGDAGSRLSGCGSVPWILWEVFVFHGFGFVGDLIAC